MSRKQDCKTRYPILLAHGLGVTEHGGLYVPWGRVPDMLRARGAEVCFGGQDAWGSIETGAAQLGETVRKMRHLYGCERVNIIAHSKGGLEARHLISFPDPQCPPDFLRNHHAAQIVDPSYDSRSFHIKFPPSCFFTIISFVSRKCSICKTEEFILSDMNLRIQNIKALIIKKIIKYL